MYDEHYVPTLLDVYQGEKSVNRTNMELEIHDTAGDENLSMNRAIQYQNADVFMICVPVANKEENTELAPYRSVDYQERIWFWKNEILSVHRDRPIFLVLTKSDLLGDSKVKEPVTKENLVSECKDHGFQGVMVTSSHQW